MDIEDDVVLEICWWVLTQALKSTLAGLIGYSGRATFARRGGWESGWPSTRTVLCIAQALVPEDKVM